MQTKLLTGVALATLLIPGAAFAQSTGTVDIENTEIVVKGHRDHTIGGFQQAATPKTRGILTQQFIAHQTPGQSVDELINQLPGVSFQNNDPYGSAGGTLTIRGFDASRISQTFDGIPLNDTGNYAIYSNQQLDPELIEQVTVNLGSTDVDSPTAAATGSTVNYRTVRPTDAPGARMLASTGDYGMFRVFGQFNTGVFTKFGTKMWLAASHQNYRWFANDYGRINKNQYNGEIYQPIGSNGDFISIAGHLNVNRNNFGGSVPLRTDGTIISVSGGAATTGTAAGSASTITTATRFAGPASNNRFPTSFDEVPYHIPRCTVLPGGAGAQVQNTTAPTDATAVGASGCGTLFDQRFNPSNTGNIRINSRFTLAQGLVLTVDPSFQYTRANGGGTIATSEGTGTLTGTSRPAGSTLTGYLGAINTGANTGNGSSLGTYATYAGRDLNGDGDTLDTVNLLAPSQTVTHRYGLTASLRYDISDTQTIRVGYTHDYGRHRQTGEYGFLNNDGTPQDVFPLNNPIRDANGNVLQKRNRLSLAILDSGFAEYVGKFFDDALTINAGVTGKFFKRRLNNYCFTVQANGNVDCVPSSQTANFAAANPYLYVAPGGTAVLPAAYTYNSVAYAAGDKFTNPSTIAPVVFGYAAPQFRRYTFNKWLPNVGVTLRFTPALSMHANYSKGLEVPGTDSLYNAFYYPQDTVQANPKAETSDNFDVGVRYTTPTVQIEVAPWYSKLHNRISNVYDAATDTSFYRNLGEVTKYGIDGSLDIRPIPQVLIHTFASYIKSKIKDNLILGTNCSITTFGCSVAGGNIVALTAGKREADVPVWTMGERVEFDLGPATFGAQAKYTGKRFINDQNLPVYQSYTAFVNTAAAGATPVYASRVFPYQVFPAAAPGYALVDVDARLNLGWAGLNDKTYLQLNVTNVFNQFYYGGFTFSGNGNPAINNLPNVQIGVPRTFSASLNVQF